MNHPTDNRFNRLINAIRWRQRAQCILNSTAWGLLLAAFIVLAFPILAGLLILAGIIAGLLCPHSSRPARLIDQHYQLKDRILTATALLRQPVRTPIQQLQIADAAEHLQAVQPNAVSPLRLPMMLYAALVVLAFNVLATAIIQSPSGQTVGNTEMALQTLPAENRALLEEVFAKTEELARQHPGEQPLQDLSGKIEALLEQFGTMDARESLAMLSEIEDAFQSAIGTLELTAMDASFQELARALELAEMTLPIARALERGDYGQAALELKSLDADAMESLSQAQRKAMSEEMQSIADNAADRNQQPLADAVQEMSDAFNQGNGELAASAADALASEVEKHHIRQQVGRALANQQMMLAMMGAEEGEGNMSGGKGTEKSETDRETWGVGSAGNPNAGPETQLQSQRQQEMLTGMLGEEGESETEVVDSHEMMQAQSALQYRERFLEYRRISESVLESEPIPLGQRQVIRRYFEAIRPE
ncbi:MAG: hypothetical protein FWG73_01405 [Planctomycetaceae bacterium]|nr:hypothetical protein [Planctomycetaceae bacterium]